MDNFWGIFFFSAFAVITMSFYGVEIIQTLRLWCNWVLTGLGISNRITSTEVWNILRRKTYRSEWTPCHQAAEDMSLNSIKDDVPVQEVFDYIIRSLEYPILTGLIYNGASLSGFSVYCGGERIWFFGSMADRMQPLMKEYIIRGWPSGNSAESVEMIIARAQGKFKDDRDFYLNRYGFYFRPRDKS